MEQVNSSQFGKCRGVVRYIAQPVSATQRVAGPQRVSAALYIRPKTPIRAA